jgi:DNA-binding transcriptional regulator YiaG
MRYTKSRAYDERHRRLRQNEVRTNAAGRKLMAALNEVIGAERAGGAGLTVREVEIPDPRDYSRDDVRALRAALGISIGLFARLTGVTPAQVEHWEQGRRVPSPMARRLFDRIAAGGRSSLSGLIVRRERSGMATIR